MAREIPLTQGQVAIVDDEDFERLNQCKWFAQWNPKTESFYAVTKGPGSCAGGIDRRGVILMHREIKKCPRGKIIDHKNGATLDNRKFNLRPSSNRENTRNMKTRASESGFKGVTWFTSPGKWGVRIVVDGKRVLLGLSEDKIELARIYDRAAIEHYGEFARLNFPREEYVNG